MIRIHCEVFFVVRKGLKWLVMIEVVRCIDPWEQLLFRVLSREYQMLVAAIHLMVVA